VTSVATSSITILGVTLCQPSGIRFVIVTTPSGMTFTWGTPAN
jgi:hypothetical protein